MNMRFNKKTLLYAGAFLLLLIAFGFIFIAQKIKNPHTEAPSTSTADTPPAVLVRSIDDLQSIDTTSFVGTVESQFEATLLAERPGVVQKIYAQVNDFVRAGTVIAEIENDAEKAALANAKASVSAAEAGVERAKATLDKARAGVREEDKNIATTNKEQAQNALQTALQSARNALLSAYATTNSAIIFGMDTMFFDAETNDARMSVMLDREDPHYEAKLLAKEDAKTQRILVQTIIERQKKISVPELTQDQVLKELNQTKQDLTTIKTFIDTTLEALSAAQATARYRAIAQKARGDILASLNTVTTVQNALISAESAAKIAANNEQKALTGTRKEDIQALLAAYHGAQATLERAQAGLQAAYAQYQKTQITTPISGTVTTLSVKPNDFIGLYKPIGTVVNKDTLEVTLFVPADFAKTIRIGDTARISNKLTARVINKATGLDALHRQIEVRLSLPSIAKQTLVHGDVVTVDFERPGKSTTTDIFVPINAVKFNAEHAVLFTVSDDSVLVPHTVTLGDIVGDSIQITSGIDDPDMHIVLDARGLRAGQKVFIQK